MAMKLTIYNNVFHIFEHVLNTYTGINMQVNLEQKNLDCSLYSDTSINAFTK